MSISHAGETVVVALCENADVGVDVESLSAVAALDVSALTTIARPEELQRLGLSRAPSGELPDESVAAAADLFTAKEAALKAIGWGFGVDPRSLHVAGGQVVTFEAEQARPLTLARVPLPSALAGAYASHVAVAW